MSFTIKAACVSHPGRVRFNNEDNFNLHGAFLAVDNKGTAESLFKEADSSQGLFVAIYDGMGGENYGELASFAAAEASSGFRISSEDPLDDLKTLALHLNEVILQEAEKKRTSHMGTTMVALYFLNDMVYLCNVGDSRAYRIRDNTIIQLSEDHVEDFSSLGIHLHRKPSLSQYLGVDPEDFQIEPCLIREKMISGDCYVLCSDGLTDMVPPEEINSVVHASKSAEEISENLRDAALKNGGRDNVTVIACVVG